MEAAGKSLKNYQSLFTILLGITSLRTEILTLTDMRSSYLKITTNLSEGSQPLVRDLDTGVLKYEVQVLTILLQHLARFRTVMSQAEN
jgi:hypothetical protein